MLFVERNEKGTIVSIHRKKEAQTTAEQATLLDPEVQQFLGSSGELEAFARQLAYEDAAIIRVVEDIVDLMIDKGLIMFTDLPGEAQKKIRARKELRARISEDSLIVDDIL